MHKHYMHNLEDCLNFVFVFFIYNLVYSAKTLLREGDEYLFSIYLAIFLSRPLFVYAYGYLTVQICAILTFINSLHILNDCYAAQITFILQYNIEQWHNTIL